MSTFLTIDRVYYLIGLVVMYLVYLTLKDKGNPKRLTTALFWFLFGTVFLFGHLMIDWLGKSLAYQVVGVFVIILAILAGTGQVKMGSYKITSPAEKEQHSLRIKGKLFLPAVLIPIFTVIGVLFLKGVSIGSFFILDQMQITLAALAGSCVLALFVAWFITGGSPVMAVQQSRRLVDSVGWAIILPQMLAMLGGVFVAAHTGDSIQAIVKLFIDPDNRLVLVITYAIGMALFTMIMGNAFAAFPVMTAGIAVPFLIVQHHADPAPLLAIGMYAGYCGTLMTPMAANFNIVPAALLELKDKYQVIKVQIPTAITLLIVNIFLMYFLAFR